MIVVVGAGRTGTTATARVLQERLGVDMGGPGRVHRSNLTGDYEDRRIRAVNRLRLRNRVSRQAWADRFAREVKSRVEPWGFKDPSSCYFLDDILRRLPGAHVIWAQRALEDTAHSWARWYGGEDLGPAHFVPEIRARLAELDAHLAGVDALTLDFTNLRDEAELAEIVRRWLRTRGQEGV